MNASAIKQPNDMRAWRHLADLFSVLVSRDIKILYKRSSLGFGWALVTPLLQLFIFSFVFRHALQMHVENYTSFVLIGVLVFAWFQGSLSLCGGLITGSKSLVNQPGFPLTLLPHVMVGVRMFHLLIALPVLFGLLWWQGIRPAWSWVSLPGLMALQYFLIVGLAYPLAALNVIFRDTQHIVTVMLQLIMFVTPVFYSLDQVPQSMHAWFHINPMVGLIESWRDVLLHGNWPDAVVTGKLFTVGAVLMLVGRQTFVSQSDRFAEEL
jgi:lipopolysaccharide transport system permease protein